MTDHYTTPATLFQVITMDTILIVEDEASVRTTLQEWLSGSKLELEILVASDAAGALQLAGRQAIDLAILDWNLGAGLNGLQLLEDLHEFQRELIAILVTGYAHKATPLDALRLGVRDYLDKNHDLTRDRFLAAVRKQLDRIRPLKRERLIHQQMERFRSVVAEALPRLETASALQNDGMTMEKALGCVLNLAKELTAASAGLLIVRDFQAHQPEPEQLRVYDLEGKPVTDHHITRYQQSLAAAINSMAPDVILTPLAASRHLGSVQLSPLESSHQHLLGINILATPSLTIVLELFDKDETGSFAASDKERLLAWQPVASLLLKLAMGERASQKMLYETLRTALTESEQFAGNLKSSGLNSAASQAFTSSLKQAGSVDAHQVDSWAEALQRLSQRYGTSAVDRILKLLSQVEGLLDEVTQVPAN